ncbi:MAG: hypothetical protein ABII00_15460, partial [Elusimicrobiota bacterium]
DTFKADAFAADMGVLYRPRPDASRPLSFAAVLKNWGTRPSYVVVSDPLPISFTLGVGYQAIPKRLKLDLDLTKYRDTDLIVAAGGEYLHPFTPAVSGAARLGLTSHRRENQGFSEITVGAGINFHRLSFDFAWVPYGTLGNTFRYSLLLRFGQPAEAPETAQAAPAQSK